MAVTQALFQGVLDRIGRLCPAAWLAEEDPSKEAVRRFLRGLQAHLDDDEVCWVRIGNAELVPAGWEDDG